MEYDVEPEGPKWNISPQNDPKWNSEISTEGPNRNISPKMEYLGVEGPKWNVTLDSITEMDAPVSHSSHIIGASAVGVL